MPLPRVDGLFAFVSASIASSTVTGNDYAYDQDG